MEKSLGAGSGLLSVRIPVGEDVAETVAGVPISMVEGEAIEARMVRTVSMAARGTPAHRSYASR